MTTTRNRRAARTTTAVARWALVAVAVTAGEGRVIAQVQSAAELTTPASTIELGAGGVSAGSYKAGEYNGLEKKGGVLIGNIDWRGGAPFDSESALRWRVKGTDLGLETRNVSAEVGVQGRFRLTFGYDELRRNRSDSYQTPYNGAGTNVLTLPGAWLVPTVAGSSSSNTAVNSVSARGLVPSIGDAPYINAATNSNKMGGLLTPTAAQRSLVDAAASADVPLFHNVNVFTKRSRYDLAFAYNFDPTWGIDADFKPEHKDGLKPMGTVSRNTGGDISTVIPDVIDTDHDQVTVNLNIRRQRGFGQAAYYGSYFRNHVPFMSWQNWASGPGGTATVNTISSAPSNNYSQVSATGGYTFTPATKLVASGSYTRGTQNDPFITNPTTPVVPVTSLNGLVVTTAFNARLTAKPAKKLSLVAAYKFDDRDNQTAIHIYQYADAEEAPAANANFPAGPNNPLGAVVAQNANANRPYSKKVNQATVDADYALARTEWVKGGYEFERINRECPGSWISCADAAVTNEQTLKGEWRANLGESANVRVDYAYGWRRAPDYNENAFLALVPYAGVSPAAATGGASALAFMLANGWTGWGPTAGYGITTGNMNLFFPSNNALANALYANNNRISELVGMRRYYVADRNRNKLRSLLNWQATERVSLEGGLDVTADDYAASTYGVQNAKSWSASLDTTLALSDEWSANVFYTYEDQRSLTAGNTYTANSNAAALTNGQPGAVGLSGNACDGYATLQQRNNNNKLDPCLNWSANMLDKVHTAGLGLTAKNLGSRLDLTFSLTYSRARWDNAVGGGNWANNILNGPGGAPTTIAAFFIPATALPTVSTDSVDARVRATCAIKPHQSLRATYAYLHMTSADWAFEGMQIGPGTISGVLPTNEQPFNYGVNVVGLSYIVTF